MCLHRISLWVPAAGEHASVMICWFILSIKSLREIDGRNISFKWMLRLYRRLLESRGQRKWSFSFKDFSCVFFFQWTEWDQSSKPILMQTNIKMISKDFKTYSAKSDPNLSQYLSSLVWRSPVSLLHLLSIYSHILLSTTQIDHSKRKLQSSVEPFYYANQPSEIGASLWRNLPDNPWFWHLLGNSNWYVHREITFWPFSGSVSGTFHVNITVLTSWVTKVCWFVSFMVEFDNTGNNWCFRWVTRKSTVWMNL